MGRGDGGGGEVGVSGMKEEKLKTKYYQLKKVMIMGFSEPGYPAAKPQQRI